MLMWSRRRMVCDNCGCRFLEDHPAFEGGLTGRLERRLVADAKVMTVQAAARRCGVGWHQVNDLVRAWAGIDAERRHNRRCAVSVDAAGISLVQGRGPCAAAGPEVGGGYLPPSRTSR